VELGLARWRQESALWREYRCGPKPSEAALRRELNALKAGALPWMREVTKNAPQQAIKNLGTAFKNFFEGRARYPQFKKKGRANDSFRADNGPDTDHPNAIQGGDARRAHRGRAALVPVQPDVQRVRGHPRRADAGGPGVGLRWLRRGPRPRPQRGDQPERPRGEFRRDSLWSGRLWPWPRGQGETSRDEAGT
jgi:hypothetical protein